MNALGFAFASAGLLAIGAGTIRDTAARFLVRGVRDAAFNHANGVCNGRDNRRDAVRRAMGALRILAPFESVADYLARTGSAA